MEREAAANEPRAGELLTGAYARSDRQKIMRLLGAGGIVDEGLVERMIQMQVVDSLKKGNTSRDARTRGRAFKNMMALGKHITDSRNLSGGEFRIPKSVENPALPPVEEAEVDDIFLTYDRMFPNQR